MTIEVSRDQVSAIAAATFPSYNGKRFRIEAAECVTLSDLNWSGGTRSQYRACTIDGRPAGGADKFNAMAPWDNPAEGQSLPVPAGFVVVEHSQFCGKDMGLRIYCNPADMPKYLASKPELTAHEKTVLDAIRSYKSSYRRDNLIRAGLSDHQIENVKCSLETKGLINKTGAITIAGRNAL